MTFEKSPILCSFSLTVRTTFGVILRLKFKTLRKDNIPKRSLFAELQDNTKYRIPYICEYEQQQQTLVCHH